MEFVRPIQGDLDGDQENLDDANEVEIEDKVEIEDGMGNGENDMESIVVATWAKGWLRRATMQILKMLDKLKKGEKRQDCLPHPACQGRRERSTTRPIAHIGHGALSVSKGEGLRRVTGEDTTMAWRRMRRFPGSPWTISS